MSGVDIENGVLTEQNIGRAQQREVGTRLRWIIYEGTIVSSRKPSSMRHETRVTFIIGGAIDTSADLARHTWSNFVSSYCKLSPFCI